MTDPSSASTTSTFVKGVKKPGSREVGHVGEMRPNGEIKKGRPPNMELKIDQGESITCT